MGASLIYLANTVQLAQEQRTQGNGDTIPLFAIITVFVLAVFVGIEVISKVPTTLHTPLMSGTNAIHGIVLVGAMLVAGLAGAPWWLQVLGFIAVVFGAGNVVGGFFVTDRMLQMFRRRPQPGGKK